MTRRLGFVRPALVVAAAAASLAIGEARAAECPLAGTVLDSDGSPVAGLIIERDSATSVTDERGHYELPSAGTDAGPVVITLRGQVAGHPAFEVFHDSQPIRFTRADGCGGDFDARALGPWRGDLPTDDIDDAFALARGFSRAFALVAELGIPTSGPPLRIEAWQRTANPETSFWVGTPSYHPTPPRAPLVGLGADASLRTDRGAPDNREYHEVGHHALALGLGASPHARADTSHGGYYRNPTSADAWTEGFATFFAIMVADHIDARAESNLYRIAGSTIDLELDYRPWDLGGLEELAVAGLLLDVVDGPRPRPIDGLPAVESVDFVTSEAGGMAVVTFQAPPGPIPAHTVGRLALTAADADVWWVDVDPSAWSEPTPPRIVIALPAEGLDTATVSGAHWISAERNDDDAMTVGLPELWKVLTDYVSTQPESNGRLLDVGDLYAALHGRFGGVDRDEDGRDDLDGLFIDHGLFADVDGDHAFDPGEVLGATGRPAVELDLGGETVKWPAQLDRRRVPLPAGLLVELDAPDVIARWWVTSVDAEGAPRVGRVTLDAAGLGAIIPPPPGEGATVTLLADADEHIPAVANVWTAAELHHAADRRDAAHLEVTVTLRRGEPARANTPLDPRLLFWAGCGATAFGLGLLIVGLILGRRRD
jgi:hypothetical protein